MNLLEAAARYVVYRYIQYIPLVVKADSVSECGVRAFIMETLWSVMLVQVHEGKSLTSSAPTAFMFSRSSVRGCHTCSIFGFHSVSVRNVCSVVVRSEPSSFVRKRSQVVSPWRQLSVRKHSQCLRP